MSDDLYVYKFITCIIIEIVCVFLNSTQTKNLYICIFRVYCKPTQFLILRKCVPPIIIVLAFKISHIPLEIGECVYKILIDKVFGMF